MHFLQVHPKPIACIKTIDVSRIRHCLNPHKVGYSWESADKVFACSLLCNSTAWNKFEKCQFGGHFQETFATTDFSFHVHHMS